jgi:hypothetical protein
MTDDAGPWRSPPSHLASIDTPWNFYWGDHVDGGLGFHLENPEGRFERLTGIGVASTRLGLLTSLGNTEMPSDWVEPFTLQAWLQRRDLFTGEPERRYCVAVEHGQITPGPYIGGGLVSPPRIITNRFIHAVELIDGVPAPKNDVRTDVLRYWLGVSLASALPNTGYLRARRPGCARWERNRVDLA